MPDTIGGLVSAFTHARSADEARDYAQRIAKLSHEAAAAETNTDLKANDEASAAYWEGVAKLDNPLWVARKDQELLLAQAREAGRRESPAGAIAYEQQHPESYEVRRDQYRSLYGGSGSDAQTPAGEAMSEGNPSDDIGEAAEAVEVGGAELASVAADLGMEDEAEDIVIDVLERLADYAEEVEEAADELQEAAEEVAQEAEAAGDTEAAEAATEVGAVAAAAAGEAGAAAADAEQQQETAPEIQHWYFKRRSLRRA